MTSRQASRGLKALPVAVLSLLAVVASMSRALQDSQYGSNRKWRADHVAQSLYAEMKPL